MREGGLGDLPHLQNTNFLRLIVIPVITVHTLKKKKEETKTVPVHSRRPSSLVS